jgi:hypothetical protein
LAACTTLCVQPVDRPDYPLPAFVRLLLFQTSSLSQSHLFFAMRGTLAFTAVLLLLLLLCATLIAASSTANSRAFRTLADGDSTESEHRVASTLPLSYSNS